METQAHQDPHGPDSDFRPRMVGAPRRIRSFLDLTVKAEYAYDYGMPQWVARIDHVLAPLHLERLFLGRHKFYHFRVWYRDTLSAYFRKCCSTRDP